MWNLVCLQNTHFTIPWKQMKIWLFRSAIRASNIHASQSCGHCWECFFKKMKKEKRKEELWGMQNFKEVIEEGNFR